MCLYALERLAALLSTPAAQYALPSITIFERSGNFGAGEVNSDTQPATSYMNRVTAQVCFAADESNRLVGQLLPRRIRPNLHEWLDRQYHATGDRCFALLPSDIPTRQLHGLALKEMFQVYVNLLGQLGVRIDQWAVEVVDVSVGDANDTVTIQTASAQEVAVDKVLFVTGNALSFALPAAAPPPIGPVPRTIAQVYPLDRQLTSETVPAGSVLGVEGLGLTAIDVILHLTEGRGGRFVPATPRAELAPPQWKYLPSGREPASIVAFSPSGMPPSCRPVNLKLSDATRTHRGRFFTLNAITRLRLSRGRSTVYGGRTLRQLDFDADVLPLVVLELTWLYYATLLGAEFGERCAGAAADRYATFLDGYALRGEAAADFLLAPLMACVGHAAEGAEDALGMGQRFEWRRMLYPLAPGYDGAEPWTTRLARFMRQDLADAWQGNLFNPSKAAYDGVLRDLRPVFCAVVDHGGLTPLSHERFLTGFMRCYMRLCNGAGIEPTAKILALIEHGLLDVSIGPRSEVTCHTDHLEVRGHYSGVVRRVSLLLKARITPFDAASPVNALYPNLLRRGLVRRWVNRAADGSSFCPGGLEITPQFHPVGRDGGVDTRFTFMGTPVEGQVFFQSAAARPDCDSAIFNNLDSWARECLGDSRSAAMTAANGAA